MRTAATAFLCSGIWAICTIASVSAGAQLRPPIAEPAPTNPRCVYLPQYRDLQKRVATLPPPAAFTALQTYEADPKNENPAGCEWREIDEATSRLEVEMVALTAPGRRLPPWYVANCDTVERRSTTCQGPFLDATGLPNTQTMLPEDRPRSFSGRIDSSLPDRRLVAVYRTTLSAVRGGRAPVRLASGRVVSVSAGTVLIAIFAGKVSPKYVKAVWYF